MLWLAAALCGCGSSALPSAEGGGGTAGAGGNPAALPSDREGVFDFLVTSLNFYYPEPIEELAEEIPNPCGLDGTTDNTMYRPLSFGEAVVNGFDLDGVASADGSGPCGQADYLGTDGSDGIDYAFLGIIDLIRPIRPDQVARGVLASAPSEGLINFGIRISGVDSWNEDHDVEVLVTDVSEVPLRGTDGRIIARSSVAVEPNPDWQTRFRGQIVDGVLTAGPSDFTLGDIDLIIIEDKVLRLRDAMIRASFTERADGVIELSSVLSGWWSKDNMLDTIGGIVLAIGANDGELACAADLWADASSNEVDCDLVSTIFEVNAVSGFLTGLEGVE
ncbi:MAG: hypothetical protein PVI24_03820 [Myxococcales bacterium]